MLLAMSPDFMPHGPRLQTALGHPVIGQPLSAGAVHSSVIVVAVEAFRDSVQRRHSHSLQLQLSSFLWDPAGAFGVSGSGQDRSVKAVERSDSAVVVTTLTCHTRQV